jgi:hypothetical protein
VKGSAENLAASRIHRILVMLRYDVRARLACSLPERYVNDEANERKMAAYWTARVAAREAESARTAGVGT